MTGEEAPYWHAVVYDVNVYLDVAQLLGPPFTWSKFNNAAAEHQRTPFRGPDRRVDSLRALALATTGRFAGPQPLQVWTSNHIDDLVATKARQPLQANHPDDRGLGWTTEETLDLVEDLVWGLASSKSNGGSVDVQVSYGCPPLSHEDGLVHRTAEQCGEGNPFRYVVTSDREFRQAQLPGLIDVMYPHEWVAYVRRCRFAASAPRPGPLP